jgi:hypothetical protein
MNAALGPAIQRAFQHFDSLSIRRTIAHIIRVASLAFWCAFPVLVFQSQLPMPSWPNSAQRRTIHRGSGVLVKIEIASAGLP